MIGRISGRLLEKQPPRLLVEAGGVGYEIDVPMSTYYQLPETGEPVVLHTHLVVREDAHLLYGFATRPELAAFRQLLRITGVGARMALALLSGLEVAELAGAVASQDVARLVRIPGIGRKTAERLLLELKGKLDAGSAAVVNPQPAVARDLSSDVIETLLALGYSEREAQQAVRQAGVSENVEDGIRAALKWLSRS